jgi:hypothetical protein
MQSVSFTEHSNVELVLHLCRRHHVISYLRVARLFELPELSGENGFTVLDCVPKRRTVLWRPEIHSCSLIDDRLDIRVIFRNRPVRDAKSLVAWPCFSDRGIRLSSEAAIPGESKNRLKKVGLANGFREQLV